MKDSTQDYYDKKAEEYFILSYSTKLDILWNIVGNYLLHEASILDLGSGAGRDLRYFSSKGYNVIGLDYSFMLSLLAKRATGQPIVVSDIKSIPIKNDYFNLVWAIGSLLHIRKDDVGIALLEVYRVLRKGALFISSMKQGENQEVDSNGRFFSYYSTNEWNTILSNYGFKIIDWHVSTEVRFIDKREKSVNWIVTIAQKPEI